jgi:serine/threonine protein kinase
LKVAITDFGLSRKQAFSVIHDEGDETETNGNLCGTPGYVDPAVLLGTADYSPQSDLFGLGCIIFNLLSGGLNTIFSGSNS